MQPANSKNRKQKSEQLKIPRIPPNGSHKTSLSHTKYSIVLRKKHGKWAKLFSFVNNKIENPEYSGTPKDEEFKGLWRDIFNQMKTHQWKSLNSFQIKFTECYQFTEKQFNMFAFHMKRFVSLKKASLIVMEGRYITDKGLSAFGSTFGRHMPNLQDLTIKIIGCKSTAYRDLEMFGYELGRNAKKLTRLNLCLAGCEKITNDSLKSFGLEIGKHLFTLEQLNLSFIKSSKFDDEGLSGLSYGITRYLPNLQDLGLRFSSNTKITDKGLILLTNTIANKFENLHSLSLDFRNSEMIQNKGLKKLANEIGQMVSLRKLVVNLEGCSEIDNKTFQKFLEEIEKQPIALQALALCSCSLPEVTRDQMLKKFSYIPNLILS